MFLIDMEKLYSALDISWKGMLAIFIAITIIFLCIILLNVITSKKKKKNN